MMRFFYSPLTLLLSLLLSSATLGLFNTAAAADAGSAEEVFLSSDASSSQAENILLHLVESRTEIEQKLLDLDLHHQAGGGVEFLAFVDCSADQEACFHAEFHDTQIEVIQAAAGAVAMQGGFAVFRASEKIIVASLGGLIAWVYSMAKRRHDPGQFALPLTRLHTTEKGLGWKSGGRKSPEPKLAPALIPT